MVLAAEIADECLYYWEGSMFEHIGLFFEPRCEVAVGVSAPVKIEVMYVIRRISNGVNKLQAEKLDALLHKNSLREFSYWFYSIALKNMIRGADGNSDRTCWFPKRAEEGVRLLRRIIVRQLECYLGPAFWINTAKTEMRFARTVDARVLLETLVLI